jgi:hypothetical protein
MSTFFSNKLPIYILSIIGIAHLFFAIIAFVDFGFGFADVYQLRPWFILALLGIWLGCLFRHRWFYYLYILISLACLIIVLRLPNSNWQIIAMAIFPLQQVFAAVLVLDIKRIMPKTLNFK